MSRSVAFPQLYPVVALICTTLDRLQIAYLICGSVAAHLHGYQARETHDVDLLADVQPRHVTRLATALQPDFANAEPRIVNEALDHARLWRSGTPTASAPSINVVYRALPTLHADIFLPSGADQSAEQRWEREQFSNRVRIVGPDQQPIWVAGIEDTLLAKTRWYHQGHGVSSQQWNDLQTLLAIHREQLNRRYLEFWARELGLADLWDAVWRGQRPPLDEPPTQLSLF